MKNSVTLFTGQPSEIEQCLAYLKERCDHTISRDGQNIHFYNKDRQWNIGLTVHLDRANPYIFRIIRSCQEKGGYSNITLEVPSKVFLSNPDKFCGPVFNLSVLEYVAGADNMADAATKAKDFLSDIGVDSKYLAPTKRAQKFWKKLKTASLDVR